MTFSLKKALVIIKLNITKGALKRLRCYGITEDK